MGLLGKKNGLNYGLLHKMGGGLTFKNECTTLMAHTKNAEGNEAGTEFHYDHGTGKIGMRLGLRMIQHDH